jgi:hypothetical protein
MTGPDQVTETAILYAVMLGDADRAKALIKESLDTELTDLYGWIGETNDLVTAELRQRRAGQGEVI